MKKTILFAILAVCLALVFACKTQPKSTEEALKGIYDRYQNDLILDGAEKYTVVKGDMLSALSRRYYDNGFYFPVIMLASSDVVVDPDKIEPGMELTIPNLQKNLDDPKARENIKNFLGEIAKLEDDRNRKADAEGMRKLANSL
jgi:hypothetical protein